MDYDKKILISLSVMELKVLYRYLDENVIRSEQSSINNIINILRNTIDTYHNSLD